MCRLLSTGYVGDVADGHLDVFPLSVFPPGPDENTVWSALQGGTAPDDMAKNFPDTLEPAGNTAWLFLLVSVLNCMYLGLDFTELEKQLNMERGRPSSAAQESVMDHFEAQVKQILSDYPEPKPEIASDEVIKSHRLGYNGEAVRGGPGAQVGAG